MRSTCFKTTITVLGTWFLFSCSPARQINRSAHSLLIDRSGIKEAHVGISIFDGEKKEFLYNYQGDKYFIPASNTKLFTMYAALQHLEDSIVGIRYAETPDSIYLQPSADPTFLHPDFSRQPVFDWLKRSGKELVISDGNWHEKQLGFGWSWDDFNSSYMAERSSFPVYGNVIKWTQVIEKKENAEGKKVDDAFVYSEPEVSWKLSPNARTVAREADATMALEGRSDGDHQGRETETQHPPESSSLVPTSTRMATWYGDE